MSPVPFVAGALNCAVWSTYGALIGQAAIQTVNFIGAVAHVAYTLVFYSYTLRKGAVVKLATFAATFFALVLLLLSRGDGDGGDEDTRRRALGALAGTMSVAFASAPLASVGVVLRDKSTECLPFYFILVTFLVTGQWFAVGVMLGDGFVKYPNMVAMAMSALQLTLFRIYPAKRVKKTASMENMI